MQLFSSQNIQRQAKKREDRQSSQFFNIKERSQSHNNQNIKQNSRQNSRNQKQLQNVNSIYDKKISTAEIKKTASTIDNAQEKNDRVSVLKDNNKTLPQIAKTEQPSQNDVTDNVSLKAAIKTASTFGLNSTKYSLPNQKLDKNARDFSIDCFKQKIVDPQEQKVKYLNRGSKSLIKTAGHVFTPPDKASKEFHSNYSNIMSNQPPNYINVYHFPVVNFTRESGRKDIRSSKHKERKRRNLQTYMTELIRKTENEDSLENNLIINIQQDDQTKQSNVEAQFQEDKDNKTNEISFKETSPDVQEDKQFFMRSQSQKKKNFKNEIQDHENTYVSVLGIQTVAQARKLREQKEIDLKQLHTRIAQLQAEEERAIKMIEDTRIKAKQMLEFRINQETLAREREEQKQAAIARAREIVQEHKEELTQIRSKMQDLQEKRKIDAAQIKADSRKAKKQIEKQEKNYLKKAQEKRFEQQVLCEASKIRFEQYLNNKAEQQKRIKDQGLKKEEKIILKKEKETRKLELLQTEVLKRLRDTQIRHQTAIEEIQTLFAIKDFSNLDQIQVQDINNQDIILSQTEETVARDSVGNYIDQQISLTTQTRRQDITNRITQADNSSIEINTQYQDFQKGIQIQQEQFQSQDNTPDDSQTRRNTEFFTERIQNMTQDVVIQDDAKKSSLLEQTKSYQISQAIAGMQSSVGFIESKQTIEMQDIKAVNQNSAEASSDLLCSSPQLMFKSTQKAMVSLGVSEIPEGRVVVNVSLSTQNKESADRNIVLNKKSSMNVDEVQEHNIEKVLERNNPSQVVISYD